MLLNGKFTNEAGVETIQFRKRALRVTNLARTVIDLVVRPQYSGGAKGVLEAVRRARGRASVRDLATILGTVDHVYPYHQALGFYLEAAGYPESETNILLEMGLKYDFYLEHQAASPTVLDARWRVHYSAPLRRGVH